MGKVICCKHVEKNYFLIFINVNLIKFMLLTADCDRVDVFFIFSGPAPIKTEAIISGRTTMSIVPHVSLAYGRNVPLPH